MTRRPAAVGWLATFAAYLAVAAYVLVERDLLPIDALARLTSAHLVFSGTDPKLATIGFVWPPIPTLVLLPFAAVPPLLESHLAVGIVSAAAAATAVVLTRRIAVRLGVPQPWPWLIAAAFALNPLVVLFAANGYSEALLLAGVLLGLDALVDFWQRDADGPLVRAGLWFGLLPMIRYETAVLAAAVGVALWLEVRARAESAARDGRVEGRMLAFSGLAFYPTALWLFFSWQIMGDPLYSMRNERSALSIAADQLGAERFDLLEAVGLAATLWTAVFPLAVAGAAACIWIGARHRSPLLVGLGAAPLALPASHVLLIAREESVPLIRYFILAIPVGLVAGVVALSASGALRAAGRRTHAILGVFLAVLLLSDLSTGVVLERGRYQTVEALSWAALSTREQVLYPQLTDAIAIGETLPRVVPADARVLVLLDEYGEGFAIVLGSRRPELFLDHTSPDYRAAVEQPWRFVDYVLVPHEEPGTALNEINVAHPGLWAGGTAWATEVEGLPETTSQWRLFRTQRR